MTKEHLIPFTKETAREMGRKGGLSRSLAKRLAVKTNAIKSGRFVSDPEVVKLITPTPKEKLLGITKDHKLAKLKELSPSLVARNPEEFYKHFAYDMLFKMENEINAMSLLNPMPKTEEIRTLPKRERDEFSRRLARRIHWRNKYIDKILKYGELRFGLGKTTNISNTQINVENKLSVTEAIQMIMNKTEKEEVVN